jgi:hypothetical protein
MLSIGIKYELLFMLVGELVNSSCNLRLFSQTIHETSALEDLWPGINLCFLAVVEPCSRRLFIKLSLCFLLASMRRRLTNNYRESPIISLMLFHNAMKCHSVRHVNIWRAVSDV